MLNFLIQHLKQDLLVAKDFDGQILHFGNVRYRLNGSGIMRSSIVSFDEVNAITLPNITMSASTNREPTILANVNEQSAYLEGKTTDINEIFNISKIIVYVRPVATGYPQT
jgi:hypothetical protein